jgi:serine/threonine-protein kinase
LIVLGLAAYLLPKMFANPDDQQIQVPRLAGLTVDQARAKIVDAGFAVGNVERAYSQKVKPNRVIDQDPAADSFAGKATQISITVSIGTRPTTVPSNIIGQPRAAAETMLQDAHLNGVFKKVDSDQPKGTVVATDPTPGTKVARDSDVNVSISRGPTEVPDVVGKTQQEAEQLIRDAGFVPKVSDDNNSTEPQGTVTGQTPPANTQLQQGSPVFITVSTGQPSSPPTSSPPTSEPTSPPTSLPTSPISPS